MLYMHPNTLTNPHFFTGNYAPLTEEHDIAALDIEGVLPSALSGSLYRVGPNPQFAPRDSDYHWFSGDGMVHAFHIRDGQVSYRNRWMRTPKWHLEHAAGRTLFGTFGNPATTDVLAKGRNGGTANTSILWHGDRLFALEESHQPFEIDPHTLAAKGHQSFGDRVTSRFTAHPKLDPESGELHFFAYTPDGPDSPSMLYGVMDQHCQVTHVQSFQAPHASMVHDFMVTRDHVLFPITPLTLSVERVMRGKPVLAWDPDHLTHVGVLRRGAGVDALRWFTTSACHVFHTLNAWDDGDTIVAYVMESDAAPGLPDAEGRPGDPEAMAARLCRWTFDVGGSGAGSGFRREVLDQMVAEFPRIDERYTGRRNRYGFYAGHASPRTRSDAESVLYDSLACFDFDAGQRTMHTLPPGDVVSEPVFVPRAPGAAEGDGWLLAVAWRAQARRSDLMVFDAMALPAGPIAIARLPHRVPFGFHGSWRPG